MSPLLLLVWWLGSALLVAVPFWTRFTGARRNECHAHMYFFGCIGFLLGGLWLAWVSQ